MFSFQDVLKESAKLCSEQEQAYQEMKQRRSSELKSLVKTSTHVFDKRRSKGKVKREQKLADHHDEIRSMYENGKSQSEIADKLGYAINSVADYMRDNNMGKYGRKK